MKAYLFVAALFLVVSILIAIKSRATSSWTLFLLMPFFALAWPISAVVYYLMWRQHATCAWCGKVTAKDAKTIQEHIMTCEKHPMRPQLETIVQVSYEIRALVSYRDRVGALGFQLEKADYYINNLRATLATMDGER